MRGIQPGTRAHSPESQRLERAVRNFQPSLKDLTHINRMGPTEMTKAFGYVRLTGIEPDGGLWMDGNKPVFASEAKYQGIAGNAMERWAKNWLFLKELGVKRYVTFCAGPGFFNGHPMDRLIVDIVRTEEPTRKLVWNEPIGRLWFYRLKPTDKIEQTVKRTLAKAFKE